MKVHKAFEKYIKGPMKKDSSVKYSFAYHDLDKDKVDELLLKADYKADDKDTDILYEV